MRPPSLFSQRLLPPFQMPGLPCPVSLLLELILFIVSVSLAMDDMSSAEII
jgi:hypothetical protein